MSYKKIFYLGLVLLWICGGCGIKEGVVQKETKSFLWFTGNTQNAVVFIDDLTPIMLNKMSSVSDNNENSTNRGKVYYEISPGKHTIVVKKSGEVVVHRNVLLGNEITKEIKIP